MAGVEIGAEIKGLDELIKKLETIPTKVEKKILQRALSRMSEKLSDMLRTRAPYGSKPHTGRTKNLPHLRFSLEPIDMNARRGFVRQKIVGNFYARFLEQGTIFMQEQPFIEPTVDEFSATLLQKFMDDLAEEIAKEFDK